MGGRASFDEHWPEVEARVRRVLAARGVAPSDREDLLQEVAARALASGVEFASAERFAAWAATVARNLHVQSFRRTEALKARMPLLARRPLDAEAELEARLDVAVAAAFVTALSPGERQALLGDTDGVRQPSAFYVQRHRLRQKLLQAMEGLGAFWTGLGRRFRLPFSGTGPGSGSAATQAAAVLAPVAAACALLLGHAAIDRARPAPPPASEAAARPVAREQAVPPAPSPAAPASPSGTLRSSANRPADRAGDGRRTGSEEKPQPLWPAQSVDAGHGGQKVTVETENRRGPQPLWCVAGVGVVPDMCVGEAPTVDPPTR